jgi:hypothetical protein
VLEPANYSGVLMGHGAGGELTEVENAVAAAEGAEAVTKLVGGINAGEEERAEVLLVAAGKLNREPSLADADKSGDGMRRGLCDGGGTMACKALGNNFQFVVATDEGVGGAR